MVYGLYYQRGIIMAIINWNVGTIQQIQGPLEANTTIIAAAANTSYKLGISLGEDDYMSWKSDQWSEQNPNAKDFRFVLNNQIIHLGRTQMYETQQSINNTSLVFPDGAPASLKIQVVHCPVNTLTE